MFKGEILKNILIAYTLVQAITVSNITQRTKIAFPFKLDGVGSC